MNSRILVAFLVAGSMSGCVIYGGGSGGGGGGGGGLPPASAGDVTFQWTLDGAACSSFPDVVSVRISIPGEPLQNAGVFSCLVNGYPGVVLHDFAPGGYNFTVEALDGSGNVLFADSGTFAVNGSVTVPVYLKSVYSYAYLTWNFASLNCSQAGISTVYVSIDNGAWVPYSCGTGDNTTGVFSGWLTSGTHVIELEGEDPGHSTTYRGVGTLITSVGAPVSVEYTLWSGGVTVEWQLPVGYSCMSGSASAYVNFRDVQTGFWAYPGYPGSGDPQYCSGFAAFYSSLAPGTYEVWVTARDSSGSWHVPTAPFPTITIADVPYASSATSPSVLVDLY